MGSDTLEIDALQAAATTPQTAVTQPTEAFAPADDPTLVLGRYRIGRRIGAGGFGAVHEAVDERLGRAVAVKVIGVESGGRADERARREARAAARLDHDAIVAVLDAGEEEGVRYLISELVEGRSLAALLTEQALTDKDVLRVGLALCDALEHAHERGVVHRDVKPANVLVPKRGKSPAKLCDFGVAHLADEPLTRTGDVVGTLAYMAPEQASGGKVDERSDLFSAALVVYEALAGANPVRGASPAATAKNLGKPIPPLAKKRSDLPVALTTAIDTALKPRPAERGTVADLGDALFDAMPEVDDAGTLIAHPSEPRRAWLAGEPPALVWRLCSGLAASAISALALRWLGPHAAGISPLAGAIVAGLLVGLLPRVGWMMCAGPLVGLAAAPNEALGVLLALAVITVPLLALHDGRPWSLPALAPLAGIAGVAAAYPAVAGQLRRWTQRLAFGAIGGLWLAMTGPVLGRWVLGGAPHSEHGEVDSTALPGGAGAVAHTTASDAIDTLKHLATSGALSVVAAYGIGAMVLPWIVRGRSLQADLVGATAWAAGIAAATQAAGNHDATLGGLLAGAIVVGIRIARGPVRRLIDSPEHTAESPAQA